MIKTALYITAACFLLLLGCKKEDVVGQQVNYTGNPQVNFNNYMDDNGSFGYHKVEAQLIDSFININIEIKLTNTTATAQNDISIYLIKVDALVSEYNTTNGTTLEALSGASTALDFDFSKPVVMKKGTRVVTIPMRLNAARLDLSKQNALGLAILKVTGADLNTGAESKLVLEFGTRNKYDGIYSIKGYGFLGMTNTSAPYTFNIPCGDPNEIYVSTSGENSVRLDGQPFWRNGALQFYNNVLPEITFNPTSNAVTNVTGYGASAALTFPDPSAPTYPARYDATSKTIYVRYRVLNPGWYAIDTLTFCRTR